MIHPSCQMSLLKAAKADLEALVSSDEVELTALRTKVAEQDANLTRLGTGMVQMEAEVDVLSRTKDGSEARAVVLEADKARVEGQLEESENKVRRGAVSLETLAPSFPPPPPPPPPPPQLKTLGLKLSDMTTARRMSDVKATELTHQLELTRAKELDTATQLSTMEMERSAAMEEAAAAKIAMAEVEAKLRGAQEAAAENVSSLERQVREAEAAAEALRTKESEWRVDREVLAGQVATAREEAEAVRSSLQPKLNETSRELRTSAMEKQLLAAKLSSVEKELEGLHEEHQALKRDSETRLAQERQIREERITELEQQHHAELVRTAV